MALSCKHIVLEIVTVVLMSTKINCITEIRLVDGPSPNEGRLEVYDNDRGWGTVCSTMWGIVDTIVACRQLGFPGANSFIFDGSAYPPGTGLVYMSNVACRGNESSLAECSFDTQFTGCDAHNRDVGVICHKPGFIGCFGDAIPRVLPDGSEVSDDMTIDACLDFCLDRGLEFAGLQYSSECYCGATGADYDRLGEFSEAGCQHVCSGNDQERCGGQGRLSVFRTSEGFCVDPGVPTNGARQGDWFRYGEKVSFACADGYTLTGNQTIQCLSTDELRTVEWDNDIPVCVEPTELPETTLDLTTQLQTNPVTTSGMFSRQTTDGFDPTTELSTDGTTALITDDTTTNYGNLTTEMPTSLVTSGSQTTSKQTTSDDTITTNLTTQFSTDGTTDLVPATSEQVSTHFTTGAEMQTDLPSTELNTDTIPYAMSTGTTLTSPTEDIELPTDLPSITSTLAGTPSGSPTVATSFGTETSTSSLTTVLTTGPDLTSEPFINTEDTTTGDENTTSDVLSTTGGIDNSTQSQTTSVPGTTDPALDTTTGDGNTTSDILSTPGGIDNATQSQSTDVPGTTDPALDTTTVDGNTTTFRSWPDNSTNSDGGRYTPGQGYWPPLAIGLLTSATFIGIFVIALLVCVVFLSSSRTHRKPPESDSVSLHHRSVSSYNYPIDSPPRGHKNDSRVFDLEVDGHDVDGKPYTNRAYLPDDFSTGGTIGERSALGVDKNPSAGFSKNGTAPKKLFSDGARKVNQIYVPGSPTGSNFDMHRHNRSGSYDKYGAQLVV